MRKPRWNDDGRSWMFMNIPNVDMTCKIIHKRFRNFQQKFTKINESSRMLIKFHEVSRKILGPNFTKCHQHSWTFMKIHSFWEWLCHTLYRKSFMYHPWLTSQCASRNTRTSPVAASAPECRATINPPRVGLLTYLTTPSGQVLAIYFWRGSPNSAETNCK